MSLLKKNQIISSAEVVDNHLILSLPNASEPVVWRMALDKIGTASFEIKPVKSDDSYKLVLKPKTGSEEKIAPFDNKEEALTALMQASDAMQRPANQTNTSQKVQMAQPSNPNVGVTPAQAQSSRKWLYLLLGFLCVVGLYSLMVKQMPKVVKDFGNTSSSQSGGGDGQIGVPQSADDYFKGL